MDAKTDERTRQAANPPRPTDLTFTVPVGDKKIFGRLWRSTLPGSDLPVYLVEQNDYFDRDDPLYKRGLYQFLRTNGTRGDYPDNCARFVFFCRAVLEAMRLLKEAVALPDAVQRDFELLDPRAVRSANPALRGELAGGLLCRADAIVEPRQVLPALRGHLAGENYEWLPGREVTEIVPNAVRDHTGAWHQCDLVILCPGASFTGVVGRYLRSLARDGVRRVRLQMMQTAPLAQRLTTAVADGDSLRYYPAYDLPARGLLPPQVPVAARTRSQLLMVQRADGGLTIGDTHEYDEPFTFDVDSDAYDHLQARAEALLGAALPRVQRRWAGVYSEVSTGPALYHRSEPEPGVVLVTGPGGRGMTCAPAIAEETFR